MEKILSKKELRVLQLLEMMAQGKKISPNQAAKKLHITTRTLQLDMEAINVTITPIEILKNEKNDLFLVIPPNYSMDYIYKAILKNSRNFTVLEKIFLSEDYTIDTLSEKMFVSTSTLRRMIVHINTALNKEDIRITINPIKIIGNERKICNFFIYLISEKYTKDDKPFSRIQMKTIDQMFIYISKKNDVKLNYPDIEKLRTWILVCLVRIKHGHFIFPNREFEIPMDLSPLNDLILKNVFKQIFRIELNNRVIYQMFVIFLNGSFAFSPKHLKEISEKSSEKEKLKVEIDRLIHNISLKSGINESNTEGLIVDIYNVSNLQLGQPYILYDKYKWFINDLKNGHRKNLLMMVSNEIMFFFKKTNIEIKAINSYLYILFTHWRALSILIRESQPVLEVGIFFNTDMEHMSMIKEEIMFRFSNRFKVEILNNLTISDFLKNARHKDLIITNISGLEQKHFKVVCFPMYPKNSDWEKVYRVYDDFLQY